MKDQSSTWTAVHDLALTLLVLVAREGDELSEDELATVTDVLQLWGPDIDPDVAQDVLMEALDGCADDERLNDRVAASVAALCDLPLGKRMEALDYVVRVAEVDGVLTRSEVAMIRELAESWSLDRLGDSLLSQSTASRQEELPGWSLLHDIGLLFVALAHGGDEELTADESAVMLKRLRAWQPDRSEEAVYDVLREALGQYSRDEAALRRAIESIGKNVPTVQRLLLLEDLMCIADADGATTLHEKEMIRNLAHGWGLRAGP